MNATFTTAQRDDVRGMIDGSTRTKLSEYERETMNACLLLSDNIWVGSVDDEFACVWGLIPPSLLSDQAYLWLHTNELVDAHKFMFIRQSQRWIEVALRDYDKIIGFARPDNARAIRWIKWLGGEFGEVDGERANFSIRKKHG